MEREMYILPPREAGVVHVRLSWPPRVRSLVLVDTVTAHDKKFVYSMQCIHSNAMYTR
jgi:hypothetical protein